MLIGQNPIAADRIGFYPKVCGIFPFYCSIVHRLHTFDRLKKLPEVCNYKVDFLVIRAILDCILWKVYFDFPVVSSWVIQTHRNVQS